MSHFVKCDRCSIQDHVTGTISLPPGWSKVMGNDLCEPCCRIVRDFINFRPEHDAALPVEPIPAELSTEPAPTQAPGDKLFPEPEPAKVIEQVLDQVADQINSGALNTPGVTCTAEVHTAPDGEASVQEKQRTRRKKKTKLQGQDAVLGPDKRTSFPHGANEDQQPGAPQP